MKILDPPVTNTNSKLLTAVCLSVSLWTRCMPPQMKMRNFQNLGKDATRLNYRDKTLTPAGASAKFCKSESHD